MINSLRERKEIIIILSMLIVETVSFMLLGLLILDRPDLILRPEVKDNVFSSNNQLNLDLFSDIIKIDSEGNVETIKEGDFFDDLSVDYTKKMEVIDSSEDRYDLMIYKDKGVKFPVLITKGNPEEQYLCLINASAIFWKESSKVMWIFLCVISYLIILFLINEYHKYSLITHQNGKSKNPYDKLINCHAYETSYYFNAIIHNTGYDLIELFSTEACDYKDYKNLSMWVLSHMKKYAHMDLFHDNLIIWDNEHSYQLRDLVKKMILSIDEMNRINPKIAFRYSLQDKEIFYDESMAFIMINYFIMSLSKSVKDTLTINLNCDDNYLEVDFICDKKIDEKVYRDMKNFLNESLCCHLRIHDKYLALSIPIEYDRIQLVSGKENTHKQLKKKYFVSQKNIVFVGVSLYNRKKILSKLDQRGDKYSCKVYRNIILAKATSKEWAKNTIIFVDAKQLHDNLDIKRHDCPFKWIGIFDGLSKEEKNTVDMFNPVLKLEKPFTEESVYFILNQI